MNERKKITKSTLKSKIKKLKHGEELTVRMYPCKANYHSYWFSGLELTISNEGETQEELLTRLDKYINEFEYYNCNNTLGNYASYYLI